MHILTLSSLALALGTLTINAKKTSPADKPKDKPLPFYNWEHRTKCTQELLNPERQDKDEWMKYHVEIVGYAWDETNGLTPDHRWNWNTTANAKAMIRKHIPWAGDLIDYKFSNGERDERGFTQFTAEVSFSSFREAGSGLTTSFHLLSSTSQTLPGVYHGANTVIQVEMHKTRGPIENGLNCVLGFEGMEFTMNSYESVVCFNKDTEPAESEGGPKRRKNPEEEPYEKVEDEMLLEKQRYQQLHKDRVAAANKALAESDRLIQEHADKVPKKPLEMQESDRRIQSIPLVIKGQSPNRVAATDNAAEGDRPMQKNQGKVPKKTAEMEESDRRIQGLPPRKAGNFTA